MIRSAIARAAAAWSAARQRIARSEHALAHRALRFAQRGADRDTGHGCGIRNHRSMLTHARAGPAPAARPRDRL